METFILILGDQNFTSAIPPGDGGEGDEDEHDEDDREEHDDPLPDRRVSADHLKISFCRPSSDPVVLVTPSSSQTKSMGQEQ